MKKLKIISIYLVFILILTACAVLDLQLEEKPVTKYIFEQEDTKEINLGELKEGETAIVAISPLSTSTSLSNYDASLEVIYSQSDYRLNSLIIEHKTYEDNCLQAIIDAEMRQLGEELLKKGLEPVYNKSQLQSQTSYELGESRSFYVSGGQEIDSSLVKISDHTLIYFEEGYTLKESTFQLMANEFDNNIYPTLMEYFANHDFSFYDWDNNGKTIILITDIVGPVEGEGMIMGYFRPFDYYQYSTSNQADMFYLNYHALLFGEQEDEHYTMEKALSTIAHEFQHLIFHVEKIEANRQGSDIWINEGLSLLAEYLSGYYQINEDRRIYENYYTDTTDVSLLSWGRKLEDYGIVSLFSFYLYTQFGSDIIKEINSASISAAEVIGKRRNFYDLFLDWTITNVIYDLGIGEKYTYLKSIDHKPEKVIITNTQAIEFTIKSMATKYLKIKGNNSQVSLQLLLNENIGVVVYIL